MKIYGEKKPSLTDALAHYGKKGMKWGVRNTNPSGGEIHGARKRQMKRAENYHREVSVSKKATTSSARASAAKRAEKLKKDFNTNEDRVTATRMTKGERVALALVAGPVGLAVIGANKGLEKVVERSVDKERAKG